jgi:hypothetical protein
MRETQNSRWGRLALVDAAVAAWLIYDMTTTTEAPGRALMIRQYVFLVGLLIGLAGSLYKLTSQN